MNGQQIIYYPKTISKIKKTGRYSVSFNSDIIFYSTIFFNFNVNTETDQFSNTASKFYDNASCVLSYIYTCLFIQTYKARLNDKTNYYIVIAKILV